MNSTLCYRKGSVLHEHSRHSTFTAEVKANLERKLMVRPCRRIALSQNMYQHGLALQARAHKVYKHAALPINCDLSMRQCALVRRWHHK